MPNPGPDLALQAQAPGCSGFKKNVHHRIESPGQGARLPNSGPDPDVLHCRRQGPDLAPELPDEAPEAQDAPEAPEARRSTLLTKHIKKNNPSTKSATGRRLQQTVLRNADGESKVGVLNER